MDFAQARVLGRVHMRGPGTLTTIGTLVTIVAAGGLASQVLIALEIVAGVLALGILTFATAVVFARSEAPTARTVRLLTAINAYSETKERNGSNVKQKPNLNKSSISSAQDE
jgi:hypothetical protein